MGGIFAGDDVVGLIALQKLGKAGAHIGKILTADSYENQLCICQIGSFPSAGLKVGDGVIRPASAKEGHGKPALGIELLHQRFVFIDEKDFCAGFCQQSADEASAGFAGADDNYFFHLTQPQSLICCTFSVTS